MVVPILDRAVRAAWLVSACCLAAAGCRFLGGGQEMAALPAVQADKQAAGRQTADRTLLLELLFVRHDEHDTALREELWQYCDEQMLPTDVRQRLAANGLRVGLVTTHLPPDLADRLTASAAALADPAATLATDAAVSRRVLRLLPGRRGEILTETGIRELVLFQHDADGVSGQTFHDASPLLAIRGRPAADRRITIEASPEIKHGPIEKSWVGEDGMFRLEAGQQRHRLEQLQFEVTLPPDGMLVVGSAGDDATTAGGCLLRDRDGGDCGDRRLLFLRPLADPIDPLFTPDNGAEAEDGPPLVVR